MNLRFDGCSLKYKEQLIGECFDMHLTSGLVSLCLETYGEAGGMMAVKRMKDFYLMIKDEEDERLPNKATLKDIERLKDMPMSIPERIPLERSSTYIGVKLMWMVRQFLTGYKFPKGTFK